VHILEYRDYELNELMNHY